MRDFAARLVLGLGVVYVLVGLVGFALTGASGFAATTGPSLLFFEINPLHNLIHIAVGGGLIAGAAAGRNGLRVVAGTIAAVYALVGIVGFLVIGTSANILALNVADNFLHLASAVLLFYAVARPPAQVEA